MYKKGKKVYLDYEHGLIVGINYKMNNKTPHN